METKSFLKSKTMWLGAATILASVLELIYSGQIPGLSHAGSGIIVGVLIICSRLATNQAVTVFRKDIANDAASIPSNDVKVAADKVSSKRERRRRKP